MLLLCFVFAFVIFVCFFRRCPHRNTRRTFHILVAVVVFDFGILFSLFALSSVHFLCAKFGVLLHIFVKKGYSNTGRFMALQLLLPSVSSTVDFDTMVARTQMVLKLTLWSLDV